MAAKYPLPDFLKDVIQDDLYRKWLHRKAAAHVRRDNKRSETNKYSETKITVSGYKTMIHDAVSSSQGLDAYTGEKLDWKLIGTYANEESKAGKHGYKKKLSLLPTVDHVTAGTADDGFHICGWRTNDAKNDMSKDEFIELCRMVVNHSRRDHE
jgi:hypothetical protein